MKNDASAGIDGDVSAVSVAVPVLGKHPASGVHHHVTGNGKGHGAGRAVSGAVVIAVDRPVDGQVPVHGEDPVDGVIGIVGRPIQRTEVRRAVDGHVSGAGGKRERAKQNEETGK
jgi:hypothetical protein